MSNANARYVEMENGLWVRRYDLQFALLSAMLGLIGETKETHPPEPPVIPAQPSPSVREQVVPEPAREPQLVSVALPSPVPAPVLDAPKRVVQPVRRTPPHEAAARVTDRRMRVVLESIDAERSLRAARRATVVVGERLVDFGPSGTPVLTDFDDVEGYRYRLRTAPSLRLLEQAHDVQGERFIILSAATAISLREVLGKFSDTSLTVCLGADGIRARRNDGWDCVGDAEVTRRF